MPPILFLRSAYIVVTGVNQLLDKVAGPAFHFFVNPGEVFADNTEADHQQTSDDKFQENHGSEPAHPTTRHFQVDRLYSQENRYSKKNYPSKGDQVQGKRGESGNPDKS